MDSFQYFCAVTYPRLCLCAHDLGAEAKNAGLPRICNLSGEDFVTPSGKILLAYKQAWEKGWDGRVSVPTEFKQVEDYLNTLPTRPMREDDL